jgi:hypothetical protein
MGFQEKDCALQETGGGRFTDDFKLAVHRLEFFLVRLERFKRNTAGETLDGCGRFQNVFQLRIILPHKSGSRW